MEEKSAKQQMMTLFIGPSLWCKKMLKGIVLLSNASLWILKISRKTKPNQKSRDFCQMFVICKKKARTLRKKALYLQIYGKSIAYGFSFFVISISGNQNI
jgi:hypothetical protein